LFVGNKLVITDFDESLLPWWNSDEEKPCKFHLTNTKPKLFQPLELSIPETDSDEKVDIYSLGAMLYNILAGVPPYDRMHHFERKKAGTLPGYQKKLLPRDRISKTLYKVATKCMVQNPNERPTAHQVVKALEKALPKK